MKNIAIYAMIASMVAALGVIGAMAIPGQSVLILGLAALIISNVYQSFQSSQAAENVREAARRVAEVALEAKRSHESVNSMSTAVDETRSVVKASHVMINSNREEQLAGTAELAHFRARYEPSAENDAKAKHADQLLLEHREKQAQSDAENPRSTFGIMPEKTETEKNVR
jgi:hypothetical protein